MRVLTPVPSDPVLLFESPLDFCLAMVATAAAGLAYPSNSDMKWFRHVYGGGQTPGPNTDTNCFNPYQVTGSGVMVKSWASGMYGYVGRRVPNRLLVNKLPPEAWREGLANSLAEIQYMDPPVRSMVEVMNEWWLEPKGEWFSRRNAYDVRVAEAIENGSLITDPKVIRRIMKKEAQ